MNITNTSKVINENMPYPPESIPIMLGAIFLAFIGFLIFYYLLNRN